MINATLEGHAPADSIRTRDADLGYAHERTPAENPHPVGIAPSPQ